VNRTGVLSHPDAKIAPIQVVGLIALLGGDDDLVRFQVPLLWRCA
jgi:hypothetical protein